jgi:hypothetical protein
MREDIPEKFWRKYSSSDILDKEKKLEPVVKNIDNLFNLKDKKLRKHTLTMLLMGYFDDLIDYMETRNKK